MTSKLTSLSHFNKDYSLGIDIGSISINTIILDQDGKVQLERYDYCQGRPFEQLKQILKDLLKDFPEKEQPRIAFTGSGGKLASEILGGIYINEVIAQSESVSRLYPDVKTVIEMGGEDSKLILMNDSESGVTRLSDFELNTLCAAGTGS
ncbi:MAG: hypothetical protein KAT31_01205, partial [Bacteroidales bacterium]|nr:hypothetical protein [Bacteroidales bacterium]